ncbi:transmembrane domain-containing protein [Cryptosporidium canis]|uniref:Transmembrane domain-containing protein n=1 Tax=Cryptosporidium canis TaxID=195482 RepID=A0A9D5HYQ5_9CRYT|nr:transmembrane domain-containing protein [Cryptosporidium canis]
MAIASVSLFPPRIWSRIISRTNGRSLSFFKYLCCCTSSVTKALNRYISLWSGLLLTVNILILILCLRTSNKYPLFLRYLFPTLSEILSNEIGIIYILLYITSVSGIITGFVGAITTYTYSIIALKICMVCNYLNIIKDIALFITIDVLLNKWHIAFINVVIFFFVLFLVFILIGLFTSFVAENLLFLLEEEEVEHAEESSTTQNTETISDSTNSRNTKNEEGSNKDLEIAKEDDHISSPGPT